MKKKPLALMILLSAALGACGRSDNPAGVASVEPVLATPLPPGGQGQVLVAPEMKGEYPYFFLNYRFVENGCDTGLRRFSGPSYQGVFSQYCQALLNDWMNQRCARSMREAYHRQSCGGL